MTGVILAHATKTTPRKTEHVVAVIARDRTPPEAFVLGYGADLPQALNEALTTTSSKDLQAHLNNTFNTDVRALVIDALSKVEAKQ